MTLVCETLYLSEVKTWNLIFKSSTTSFNPFMTEAVMKELKQYICQQAEISISLHLCNSFKLLILTVWFLPGQLLSSRIMLCCTLMFQQLKRVYFWRWFTCSTNARNSFVFTSQFCLHHSLVFGNITFSTYNKKIVNRFSYVFNMTWYEQQ